MASKATYTLYGWQSSFFSVKAHRYMKFKNITKSLKLMSAYDFYYLTKKVKATVMPIVLDNTTGKYIQDTRDIIDELELKFPNTPSVFPTSPKKKFVACLIEAWVDEFWIAPAMHYRWNYESSVEFFENEVGQNLLPYCPGFLRRMATEKISSGLISMLPNLGIRPEQHEMIERWTIAQFTLLEAHFTQHDYLLAHKYPTIADFALAGPLCGHMLRDPGPRDHVFTVERFPKVLEWMKRMNDLNYLDIDSKNSSNYDDSDDIPETLLPIIDSIFVEFVPMIASVVKRVSELESNPKYAVAGERRALPRKLSEIQFPFGTGGDMGGAVFRKNAIAFGAWKMQKVLDEYHKGAMSDADKAELRKWLSEYKVEGRDEEGEDYAKVVLDMKIPRVERDRMAIKFAADI